MKKTTLPTLLFIKTFPVLLFLYAFFLSAPIAQASIFGNGNDPGTFPGTVLPVYSTQMPAGTGTLLNENTASFFNQPRLVATGIIYNGSIPLCGLFCEVTQLSSQTTPTQVTGGSSYFGRGTLSTTPSSNPVTVSPVVGSVHVSFFGNASTP